GTGEEESSADDIGGGFDAPEGAFVHTAFAAFQNFVRNRLFAHGGAWSHAIHVDPPFAQLPRHHARERDDAAFGGGVMRHVAGAAEGSSRCDVDDLAAPLLFHDRDGGLAAEKNAFQVYFNDAVPFVQR